MKFMSGIARIHLLLLIVNIVVAVSTLHHQVLLLRVFLQGCADIGAASLALDALLATQLLNDFLLRIGLLVRRRLLIRP